MVNQMPRIVVVGEIYPLEDENIWICRRSSHVHNSNLIQIDERTDPITRTWHISRKHALIRRDGTGVYRIFDKGIERPNGTMSSTNGTVWRRDSSNEWRYLPKEGIALMSSYIEISIGYTNQAPNSKDKNGNPILPGPYKVIEFAPPEIPATAVPPHIAGQPTGAVNGTPASIIAKLALHTLAIELEPFDSVISETIRMV